ncbi:MAG: Tat pathway signal protein, partial [Caldimonas sp.]
MTINASRRAFLQRASALSLAGSAAPWAINLAAMGEAAAAGTPSDYKALVCVFLYGGNDYGNTLVPYDTPSYNLYQGMRPTLAYSQAALAPTVL